MSARAALVATLLASCYTPSTVRLAADARADAASADIPADIPTDIPADIPADIPTDIPRDAGCDAELARAESHCGSCGRACGAREVCVEGRCDAVVSLAAGRDHTCAALAPSGRVLCWGANDAGQLGLGDAAPALVRTPALVPGIDGVAAVVAGRAATCALRRDGSVWCWGENVNARGVAGRLGVGSDAPAVRSPAPVRDLADARALVAGEEVQCALDGAGTARCWGGTSLHAFGGRAADGSYPTFSAAPLALETAWPVAGLTVGANHLCARSTAGAVRCWGANGGGQLGTGTTVDRRAHSLGEDAIASGATEVAAGARITCAAFGGRQRVACWGSLDMLGLAGAMALRPVEVAGTEGWRALSLSARVVCGISGATLGCFGENRYGQLGRGAASPDPAPPAPVADLTVADGPIAAGTNHACAVDLSGAVRCWGEATALGDGAGFARSAPSFARDLP